MKKTTIKVKLMEKNESLRGMWESTKMPNIHTISD